MLSQTFSDGKNYVYKNTKTRGGNLRNNLKQLYRCFY